MPIKVKLQSAAQSDTMDGSLKPAQNQKQDVWLFVCSRDDVSLKSPNIGDLQRETRAGCRARSNPAYCHLHLFVFSLSALEPESFQRHHKYSCPAWQEVCGESTQSTSVWRMAATSDSHRLRVQVQLRYSSSLHVAAGNINPDCLHDRFKKSWTFGKFPAEGRNQNSSCDKILPDNK